MFQKGKKNQQNEEKIAKRPIFARVPLQKSREKCIGSCCFPNFFVGAPLYRASFPVLPPVEFFLEHTHNF